MSNVYRVYYIFNIVDNEMTKEVMYLELGMHVCMSELDPHWLM